MLGWATVKRRKLRVDELHAEEGHWMPIVSFQRRDSAQPKGRSEHDHGEGLGQNQGLDENLGHPAGQDDHARFTRLVLPHLGDAYSLARWITGSRTDAEDVVQDASLRAFRAIASLADGSARPWMLTIVRNTAYTWMRKNRPSAVFAVEDLESVETAQATPGDPDKETPETALIAKADTAALEAAIAALPMQYRETMILRDVQGLTYREIAQVTGVPIGTVMSRLARGRDQVIKSIRRNTP
jgi:RNA polymerase sigma-70 factor, ECF subfamily